MPGTSPRIQFGEGGLSTPAIPIHMIAPCFDAELLRKRSGFTWSPSPVVAIWWFTMAEERTALRSHRMRTLTNLGNIPPSL